MKKLTLPLLFIFLTAAAFGQTKKEMPKINAKEFKQIEQVKLAPKSVKHLKAAFEKNPSFAKYWKIDNQALKPKAGYGFLSNGKGRVVTCRTGSNGKPNLEKAEGTVYETDKLRRITICICNTDVEDDDCFFYSNPKDPHNYGCVSPSGVCECDQVEMLTDKTTGVTTVTKK